MRISAFDIDGEEHAFVETPDGVADLGFASLDELLRADDGTTVHARLADAAARATPTGGPPAGARRLAPIRRPGKQLFVGVNYTDHVAELPPPWTMTAEPFVFAKLPSAIIGPDEPIRLPAPDASVDYEAELLVVIGRRASRLTPENALEHVLGYTIVNDVTERAVQATDNQLTMAKGLDTFCPIGPAVVLTDELDDPTGLAIWTTVNGEERQRSNTRELIFPVVDLLVRLTRSITLEPGDTVSTGTPAGVGAFRTPPQYLAPCDVVTVGIDGIGELTNPVVAGWS
ncbi:MAG: fumarylacetoacetate hydrolase family protein [Solirubrobacterales bacterium]|nr:fumarylacetoacetate hydrolase family protein [Solirubrobacterales bacterium]